MGNSLFRNFCERCSAVLCLHALDSDPAEVHLLAVMLLPGVGKKRVYNLQSKQIVKLLSQIFSCDVDDMVEDLGKVCVYVCVCVCVV